MQIQFVCVQICPELLALYQHCQENSGARRKAPQWELPRHGPSLWLQQRAVGNNKGRGREQSQRCRRRRQSRQLPRARNRTRATEKQLIPNSLTVCHQGALGFKHQWKVFACKLEMQVCKATGSQQNSYIKWRATSSFLSSHLFLKNQTMHVRNQGESQFLC